MITELIRPIRNKKMKSLVRLSTAVTLRRQKEDVIQFSNKKFVGDPLFLMQKKKTNEKSTILPTQFLIP